MKVLLAGGGTLGPVTPLLALVEAWRNQKASVEFVFVGTPDGPERSLVHGRYQIPFLTIPVVRFPRFISFEWLSLPFRCLSALIFSAQILRRQKPDVIVGAGGFTQVPIIIMGKLFGIPSVIFQTDVHPLLSTRFALPFVERVFVAWKETVERLHSPKVELRGVPVRTSLMSGSKENAFRRFGLDPSKKMLLVFGGGTGSLWINEQMGEIAPQIKQEMNVIHITGKGKELRVLREQGTGYVSVEYLEDGMEDVYAAADLVLCRAGLGTISELSRLSKSAIVIPLPHSAQEKNANLLEQNDAARVLLQEETTSSQLLEEIRSLMQDSTRREHQAKRMHELMRTDVGEEMIQIIEQITQT